MTNRQTITHIDRQPRGARFPGTLGELHEQLIEAAQCGDTQTIAGLLTQAPELRHYADAQAGTPLHHAVARNQFGTVRLLLLRGFSPNAPDALGMTPLHLASMRDLRATRLLLFAGADPTQCSGNGYDAWEIAMLMGQFAIAAAIEDHIFEMEARETLAKRQILLLTWLNSLRGCFSLN